MSQERESYLDPQPPPQGRRSRTPLLAAWLIFFITANVWGVLTAGSAGNVLSASWSLFGVFCGIGVWLWYRMAYYGMLLGFGYAIAASLDRQSVEGIVFALAYMALTWSLVTYQWENFK